MRIVVSNILCCVLCFVFSSSCVLCTPCCQFLWIVHFGLPLRNSLTFIYGIVSLHQQSRLMLFKQLVSTYTIRNATMLSRLYIETHPLLYDIGRKICCGASHNGVGIQTLNWVICCYPMNHWWPCPKLSQSRKKIQKHTGIGG